VILARGSVGPREFVRLTPVQFSVLMGIIVLLMAGAGIAGYLYGLGETERRTARALTEGTGISGESAPSQAQTADASPVTFYTALTERRNGKAVLPPEPEPAPPAREETVPARTSIPPEGGSVIIQVASYRTREPAQALLENLSAEGYRGGIETADLGERGTWFRVRLGPFRNEAEAGKALEKLREERSLKGFIVR